MHATDTLDYIVILKRRIGLYAETGRVELSVGDLLVDRGVSHGRRAIGNGPAMTAVEMLPAHLRASGAIF